MNASGARPSGGANASGVRPSGGGNIRGGSHVSVVLVVFII